MSKLICILGPTASGKTALALALANQYPIEIINVDSAQIYHGMDIGSGKPDKAIREQVPHHLMDFLDPAQAYSAAQFREDALICIEDILSRDRIPLLVGGTMLYFKALQQGLAPLPTASPEVRQHLMQRLQNEGLASLYEYLLKIDPQTAARLAPTDPQRILRAIEIYEITQKPMSHWLEQQQPDSLPYEFMNIALMPITTPRSVLHERIAARFDAMLEQGLIEEVRKLKERADLNADLPAIRAVGYRQVWLYLEGKLSFEEMREKTIAATRQLAKRQMTWLRHWPDLQVFDFAETAVKDLKVLLAFL